MRLHLHVPCLHTYLLVHEHFFGDLITLLLPEQQLAELEAEVQSRAGSLRGDQIPCDDYLVIGHLREELPEFRRGVARRQAVVGDQTLRRQRNGRRRADSAVQFSARLLALKDFDERVGIAKVLRAGHT